MFIWKSVLFKNFIQDFVKKFITSRELKLIYILKREKLMSKKSNREKIDKLFGLVALLLIFSAWIIGYNSNGENLDIHLKELSPNAVKFEQINSDIFSEYKNSKTPKYFIARGESDGYGGKLVVLTKVDSAGTIINSLVVSHKETQAFFEKTISNELLESLNKKSYKDKFLINDDVDAVSGATYTSRAITSAAGKAVRKISREILKLETRAETEPEIKFEIPIFILLALFVIAYLGAGGRFKNTNKIRWIVMISGLILIGFIFTRPISLAVINKFLLGYFPVWQTNIYWYVLLAGIFLSIFISKKNLYCEWICPFGAVQECVGKIGGFNKPVPKKSKTFLIWIQRILALSVILTALIYRNPNYFTFEIFGTFFQLVGSTLQFSLMGLFLVTAIFINRPWCNVLCPVRPITDFTRMVRKSLDKTGTKKMSDQNN